MKRLLLLLPLLVAAPVRAQVDPAIHKLCVEAKDYAGCVQTQSSLSNEVKAKSKSAATTKPTELTEWQKHLNDNPGLKVWVEANPSLGAKKKEEWEKANYVDIEACSQYKDEKQDLCFRKRAEWLLSPESDDYQPDPELMRLAEDAWNKGVLDGIRKDGTRTNQCPPGTRVYRKTALFGLIKGKEICLSDYEAESLRARQLESVQENIRNMETQRRLEDIERQVRFNGFPIIIP